MYGYIRPASLHTITTGSGGTDPLGPLRRPGPLRLRRGRLVAGGGYGAVGGLRSSDYDRYVRKITGVSPSFVGPSVAPTAFQSFRGGLNQIGIRGGAAIAGYGLKTLANTTEALSEEDAAANQGSGSDAGQGVRLYQAAQAKEFAGRGRPRQVRGP